ncbi:XdhC family protein [Arthrobacter cupressi]|uniref:Xanthine dehydrogenase accessory factor n=1 Tax=Arthrobacter cupressi TaxID=1045773 RepID=A0A1G8K896_9MICC|nr:XdhC/CoxI family protein [Arthrobacter cupressi]NYD77303.1 xanthine dehydrogenase accessory factor [Arthrobacter cupressi]SDI39675.1 xanthine dehydrogenase accessory factor [Arthrobacter cupressi]
MLDLMPSLGSWRPAVSGQRCAVATIVGTGGSVPRPMGTSMMVSEDGQILGSLSGGCVEGAVVEAALEAMRDGGPRLESFGYSSEDAFAVGLTCGGELEVHIQPLVAGSSELALITGQPSEAPTALALIRRLDTGGGVVVINDPVRFRAMESPELAKLVGDNPATLFAAAAQVEPLLQGGRAGLIRLAPPEGCIDGWVTLDRWDNPREEPEPQPITLFVESRLPAARMLVFGANDFGAALLPAGQLLGYNVTLCDARPAFAQQSRFSGADHVVTDWPHRYLESEAAAGRIDHRTVVCVLTHDPKFDIPLLETALGLKLAYVGAMGSRRSHRQRIDALLDKGTPAEALERLHSPIGLELGAVTPAEVAVSITAEIVAERGSRACGSKPGFRSLKDSSGPIHSGPRTSDSLTQEDSWT